MRGKCTKKCIKSAWMLQSGWEGQGCCKRVKKLALKEVEVFRMGRGACATIERMDCQEMSRNFVQSMVKPFKRILTIIATVRPPSTSSLPPSPLSHYFPELLQLLIFRGLGHEWIKLIGFTYENKGELSAVTRKIIAPIRIAATWTIYFMFYYIANSRNGILWFNFHFYLFFVLNRSLQLKATVQRSTFHATWEIFADQSAARCGWKASDAIVFD